jgi:serine/threonine protein kinase
MVYSQATLSNIEPTPFGDKYVLVEHIATGGMAEIYRAQYTGIEGFAKELVVKRLREEFAERPDVVQMFLDEARVAATLTHNNVVHTYDLGEISGEYFIAMELLKGEELVAVLRRGAQTQNMIPLDLGIGVIMQSLEGLHYAHDRSDDSGTPLTLVHRDINPTNIHVGYDGLCKIVDFGIAATRATAARGSSQFAGKLSYMPPEQVLGEPLDGRADIFAIGVILYEMSLGRRLFRGKPDDVRRRILEGDVPAPTFVDPEFPPALEAIIMKALEPNAADRYQIADHMYRDLEAFMAESGLSWTQRKISAFMSELFGEGAPAEVNYEDQYDDLEEDDALDFERFESLERQDDDEDAPDWARSIDGNDGGGNKAKRSLTIGNLEALVADMGVAPQKGTTSAAESGVRKQLDPNRASGRHKIIHRSDDAASESSSSSPVASSSGSRRGSAPRKGAGARQRPGTSKRLTRSTATLSTSAVDPSMTGSFAQSVMTQQSKRVNPLIWLVVVVLVSSLGYFAYTILTQK